MSFASKRDLSTRYHLAYCGWLLDGTAVGVCRTQFMTQMVNGLMKLGLPQNATLENRRLSLDLAGLVVHWEQRRIAESEAAPAPVRTTLLFLNILCCSLGKM